MLSQAVTNNRKNLLHWLRVWVGCGLKAIQCQAAPVAPPIITPQELLKSH